VEDILEQVLSGESLKLSFEQGLKVLEKLVEKVESGDLPLNETMIAYEKGAEIIKNLKLELQKAEEKITLLKKGE
jgi:exodeoxyribonuclease VII small subunit